MKELLLGEKKLTLEEVVEVARHYRPVKLSKSARERVEICREIVNILHRKGIKVYGITTGFASHRDRVIPPEESSKLSVNLIRSHCCSVGSPFPEDVVRAAMLVRANALALGNSGVRPEVIEVLLEMLNHKVYPYVPEQGSCGSSGDLAPLSHLTLVAIGDPTGRVHRRILGTEKGLQETDEFHRFMACRRSEKEYIAMPHPADFLPLDEKTLGFLPFRPITLAAKEGLAFNNGAVFAAVVAALSAYDAAQLVDAADLIAALSYEAIQAVPDCLNEGILSCRPHKGHVKSARNIRAALDGSALVLPHYTCGFNMAYYNRTLMALHRLSRKETIGDTERKYLEDLLHRMHEMQKEIWERIELKRKKHEKKDARSMELEACAEIIAPLLKEWEISIGIREGETPSYISPALKKEIAEIYFSYTKKIVRVELGPDVQDNYSFRAAATVHGTARDAIERARECLEIEINAATDNPLIILDKILEIYRHQEPRKSKGKISRKAFGSWLLENWHHAANNVKSGANFHGEPIGIVADHLASALTEIGNISERRSAMLIDERHSKGLPSCLIWKPGVNSGFLIPQYTAASLVTENKILSVPATTDSIPTGEGFEDYVSMATTASRKCAQVLGNAERIFAIEMLSAYQAVQFRKPAHLGKLTKKLEALIAREIGGLMLRLGGWQSGPEKQEEKLQEMRRSLSDFGLSSYASLDIQPCVLQDLTFYPLLEASAHLIRRGNVSLIVFSHDRPQTK